MMGFMGVLSLLLVFPLAATAGVVARPDAKPPAVFAFGDSLSDVGANNVLPQGAYHADHPYNGIDFPGGVPTGRVTNGYNFIDILAQHMGFELSPPAFIPSPKIFDDFTGVNFASGGSGILATCVNATGFKMCFTMKEQIDKFAEVKAELQQWLGIEAATQLISNSIFVFTCGGNDIFYTVVQNLLNQWWSDDHMDEYVAKMTAAFSDQLKELYDEGARKLAIINVPALGVIPPARLLLNVTLQGKLTEFAHKFNEAESRMVGELSSTLPGMPYTIGNAFQAILDIANQPEEHGIKNVTSPCCGGILTGCTPTSSYCSNRSEYAFWDMMHPTEVVIKYASNLFYNGDQTYANPINLNQLVEAKSSGGGVEAI